MKKSLLFYLSCFTTLVFAQQNDGVILYTESIDLKIDIPEEHKEMMKNIPTQQIYKRKLIIRGDESFYTDHEVNQDLNISQESEGMDMQIVIQKPKSNIYVHSKTGMFINEQEFFGRMFLITEKNRERKWKITGEQKVVLGKTCLKAETEGDAGLVVAWFCPEFAINQGPSGYFGLPGLILALESNNGERKIIANQIEWKQIDKSDIIIPNKGKEVSQQEFNKIKADKMKEMGAEEGGSGMKMIIKEDRR